MGSPAAEPTPENIPLGELANSQSNGQLTVRTESTVFSLSRSESLWTTESSRTPWDTYHHPIILLSTGGAIFISGFILSGLYFANISRMTTNILGPALLSIGLMILVVGLVWLPIIREKRKKSYTKRRFNYYSPPFFNLSPN